ncbi:MAG: hypothetical protein KF708_14195 [Pirellulales bacterium]|nr:hypothetical protein [Pirellulales bacterium]
MFEKLDVYQKAVTFADEIAALTQGYPRGYGFLREWVLYKARSEELLLRHLPRASHARAAPQLE